MNERGNDAFWQKHAGRYDRATLILNRKFHEMAALAVDDLRGRQRVLEVAAGTGLVTIPLVRAVGRLVATDRAADMLKILAPRLGSQGLTDVSMGQADVLHLPFADATFDGAVAANLLHLLPEPARALAEIRRVLKPGAVLAIPTFEHGATLLAQATSRVLALAGFPVCTRFRGAMLTELAERCGFKVQRTAVFPGILPLRYLAASPTNQRMP